MSFFPRLLSPCRARPFSTIPQPPALPPTRTRRSIYPATFLIGTTAGLLYNYSLSTASPCLNQDTFTAYTLTSHTPVSTSPTQTSILTLLPPPTSSPAPFSPTLLQSIEIKNPQVQIARHYTPLPSADGAIRLLIKREPDGEMTRYLFTLPPFSTVELRGPHTEYALSPGGKLLFLAGGTGIAPALQCAQKLLSTSDSACMRILWAVRHRAETEGSVMEEVERLKRAFGGRLQVGVFADEEGGIAKGVVRDGVLGWGAGRVLVSGPEGFIEYWAGRKGEWVLGKETQGLVGGILGAVLHEKTVEVWKL